MNRKIFLSLFTFALLICLLTFSTYAQKGTESATYDYEKPGYAQNLLGDYVYDSVKGEHNDDEQFAKIVSESNKYPTIKTEIMPNGTYREKKENKFYIYYDRNPKLPNAKIVCLAYEVPDDTPLDADTD